MIKIPLQQEHRAQLPARQQQGRSQPHKQPVVQPKMAAASQTRKQPPAAPPVYRPQPTPRVLQQKKAAPPPLEAQSFGVPPSPFTRAPHASQVAQRRKAEDLKSTPTCAPARPCGSPSHHQHTPTSAAPKPVQPKQASARPERRTADTPALQRPLASKTGALVQRQPAPDSGASSINWSEIEALLAREDFGASPHPDEMDLIDEPEPDAEGGPEGVAQACMRPGVIQMGKQYNANTLVSSDTTKVRDKLGRGAPLGIKKKGFKTRAYSGRTYYYTTDDNKRVVKYQGALSYVNAPRSATMKTRNKRKTDENAHLIAHSIGGDPKFSLGYVAMARSINRDNGDWYQMEGYIRDRLKAKNTRAYMAVKPHYPSAAMARPDYVMVSVYFNRSPYKITFKIDTP